MFGYVLPDKQDLRLRELDQYRAVYCSLCYALRGFGVWAKYLLNYDFAFSAMLAMSLSDRPPDFYDGRCNTNPFKKEKLMRQRPELQQAAAALIIASHYKFADDCADERLPRRVAARLGMALTTSAYQKARGILPDFDRQAASCIADQHAYEAEGGDSVDRAADASARGLGFLFSTLHLDPETSRILERLGYLTGRYVYLADAADDLTDDLRRGRYNVLALQYSLAPGRDPLPVLTEARALLRQTAGEIALCYRLLTLKYFTPVLDNIIHRGLLLTAETVGAKSERTIL